MMRVPRLLILMLLLLLLIIPLARFVRGACANAIVQTLQIEVCSASIASDGESSVRIQQEVEQQQPDDGGALLLLAERWSHRHEFVRGKGVLDGAKALLEERRRIWADINYVDGRTSSARTAADHRICIQFYIERHYRRWNCSLDSVPKEHIVSAPRKTCYNTPVCPSLQYYRALQLPHYSWLGSTHKCADILILKANIASGVCVALSCEALDFQCGLCTTRVAADGRFTVRVQHPIG